MKNNMTDNMLSKINSLVANLENAKDDIDKLAIEIAKKINEEGRIIFVGAGISPETARIIIDELWFNFQIPKNKFLVLTAGKNFLENMEDWKELEEISSTSVFELDELDVNENDLIIGLSSSGRTEYVISAIKYTKDLGCTTAIITDKSNTIVGEYSDIIIDTKFGDSTVKGLVAAEGGTIQKIILDLIIYNAMEKVGRIYKNNLVFIKPISKKLEDYSVEVIMDILGVDSNEAREIYESNNKELEIALISKIKNVSVDEARNLLLENKKNFNNIVK